MTNLTEKWKSGELINEEDAGCYYIETIDGEIYSDCLSPIDGFKNTYNYAVKKILAPVPSYEEWQKLNGGYDWLTLRNKALIEENQKLFSLLFITAKSLQDMADGKIPYTSFGYYAKQILEHIKEQK